MSEPEESNEKAVNEPLAQREVIDLLFRNPAVRAYLYAALAALAMIFVVMFMNGSDIGAVLVVLLGCAGLFLRWVAAPAFVLIVLCYFQMFPFGFPEAGYESVFEVRDSHGRVVDAVLVMAVLVYLRSQYRLLGLLHQAVPFENTFYRKGDGPRRRPPSHIAPGEIGWMLAVAGGIVVLGQIGWWLVNALEFTPNESSPIRWAEEGRRSASFRGSRPPGEFSLGANRFFILLGILFFGTLVARLIFGYWRLRMMKAAEGSMILVDTSWAASHRERVRVEKWRLWGLQRTAEKAREAKRAEREREQEQEQRERRHNTHREGQPMKFVYWSREIAGWALIVIGLWKFWDTYVLLTNKRIFEAGPTAFIAFIIFRGGIHLLKVAVAAQVARTLPETAQPQTRRAHRLATRSYAPTAVKSVVPGPKTARTADNGQAD